MENWNGNGVKIHETPDHLEDRPKRLHSRTTGGASDNQIFEDKSPDPNLGGNTQVVISRRKLSQLEDYYDPHLFGNTNNATSYWGSVFHLITISGGPAILSIPKACQGVGYATAGVLMPLIVLLYVYCMHMVVWSEYEICKMRRVPNSSYPDVVYHAFRMGPSFVQWFAPYGKALVYVLFLVLWFLGACYDYMVVCQNLQVISQNVFDYSVDVQLLLVIFIVPFLLLFCIRSLNYLVPFSFLANIFNYVTFVLVVYYIFTDPAPWNIPQQFGTLGDVPVFIGTVLFTVSATGIIIPLKNEMKNPKKFDSWGGVLCTSYVPVCILFTSFSLISYLKYGSSLRDSVIENLPKGAPLAQAGILLSTACLIFQYPLLMYVCFDLIWNHIFEKRRRGLKNQLFWEYVLRAALVLLSTVVSFVAPNVFVFASLGGNLGSSMECFILPAFMETLVVWKKYGSKKWKLSLILFKNTLILLLAFVFVAAGVVHFVANLHAS